MLFKKSKTETIFDIGAHTGEDTEFYLEKGFKVIAIEANPEMCARLEKRFGNFLKEKKLVIIQKAIVDDQMSDVSIYVNDNVDSWSSIYEDVAGKGVHQVRKIDVESVTLKEICDLHGSPYFMKVDIELADILVAKSIHSLSDKPKFCSFEIHSPEIIHVLNDSGYTRFQIRNQMLNGLLREPKATREGKSFWPHSMDGYHSGLFGLDLPEKDWVSYQEIIKLYEAYLEVAKYSELGDSWFDIHVTKF
jgi:FkbM family methyltransferase